MMMGYGYGMGWMWLFWLPLFVGIVLLVVLAVRVLGGGISRDASADTSPGPRGGDRPLGRSRAREVLDERYARGELSTDEYRERLQVLGEDA